MPARSHIRILIAEDEYFVAESLRGLLEENGYTVVGRANDGVQAVELCVEQEPDVVFMDLKMPRMDGIEATEKIMEKRPTPVVMITAFDNPDLLEEANRVGCGAILLKPPDVRQVEQAIMVSMARFKDMMELRRVNGLLLERNQQLESSKRKLQAIFDCATEAIFIHDWNKRIVDVNPEACRRLQYSREELLSMTLDEIDAPESQKLAPKRIEKLLAGQNQIFQVSHRRKDGTLVRHEVSAGLLELPDSAQPLVLSLARELKEHEMTEGAEAAREKESSRPPFNPAYKDSSAMAPKDSPMIQRFLARVSHTIWLVSSILPFPET